ncbi:MAG: histidinol dehydrogenase [Pseudomonadota bacterium]|jgi:histidinol dehydrogenase
MLQPQRLSFKDADFWDRLKQLLAWESTAEETIFQKVKEILHDVKTNGDAAVLEYTNRFDRRNVQHIDQIKLSQETLKAAWDKLPSNQQVALQQARDRIIAYHQRQKQDSWQYQELDGTILGQKITPLDRVGLYVPGGKAAYPSSVLMNALPAKVAGVGEIIMVVPAPDGVLNDMVLAAAYLSEVNQVFTVGGAQAVAALAYGTQSIPAVDKIVGPGNIYVATAKSLVFGTVGIDMIAGPSEILVICDGKTNPDWIAMDLFSQAEHDELAQPILIAQDAAFLDQVQTSMNKLIETMPRKEIISVSIQNRSAFVLVETLEQAAEVSNYIAPEHLELSIDNPETLLPLIRHAGAIFLGRFTAEALGDYCAGPNHVLPTSRSARFSSPLGVYDFQKRSSIIHCSENGASDLGKIASILAHGEGLTAHARSAEYRIK